MSRHRDDRPTPEQALAVLLVVVLLWAAAHLPNCSHTGAL